MPFDFGTPDGYEFFLKAGTLQNLSNLLVHQQALWIDQVHHDTYDDYWKARNLAAHLKNIHCAVLTVGGWFDAEDLQAPSSCSTQSIKTIRESSTAGGRPLGARRLGALGWRSSGQRQFRREHRRLLPQKHSVSLFRTIPERDRQRKIAESLCFRNGHQRLAAISRVAAEKHANQDALLSPEWRVCHSIRRKSQAAAFDEYVSDPAKPVPFVNYVAQDVPQEYMVSDQRFAASRPDVLTYQTEVLQEDVTIVGPVSPRLFVSTSGTDSDWDVKLIDVYPPDYPQSKLDEPRPEEKGKPLTDVPAPPFIMGGYEQLVRGEPFRGKFRHSFETPEPFVPGQSRGSDLRDARREPHVSPRPSHHGADSKHLVPAHRSQSANLLEYPGCETVRLC